MTEDSEVATLVAPLREIGPEPAPAFSVEAAFMGVRVIRRRRVVLSALMVALIGLVIVVAPSRLRWPWTTGPDTYSLAAAHVSASMWPVTQAQADALMPDHNAPDPQPGGQLIAGTVRWTPPPGHPDDWFVTLYLIDNRTRTQPVYWCPTSDKVSIGRNPADDRIAQRYPWLSMVGSVRVANGWTSYSDELSAYASQGSITFIAVFPISDAGMTYHGHYALAPIQVSDLTLAIVYHDVDGNGGWADRVPG